VRKLFLAIGIVFIIVSCDLDIMDEQEGVVSPENEGLKYLTVTYHSEGHTAGEVPVDPKKYPVPRITTGIPPRPVVNPELAVVLDRGTLENEGYYFGGWMMRPIGGEPGRLCYPSNWERANGEKIYVMHNIDFDAYWYHR
jgi:hypothetical protein